MDILSHLKAKNKFLKHLLNSLKQLTRIIIIITIIIIINRLKDLEFSKVGFSHVAKQNEK